jgi:ATP-dependent Clp protease ATP-binding subunit ClpB
MNLEKFTERSRGFLQAAQTIAMRESHQRLLPEHLLKALMDDEQGLAANLIRRAGGAPERVTETLNAAIGRIAKVSGDAGQTYLDQQTAACSTRPRRSRRRRAIPSFPWSASSWRSPW